MKTTTNGSGSSIYAWTTKRWSRPSAAENKDWNSIFHSDDYLRSTYDYEVKLILLGNGAVGKTCLLNALLDNFFDVEQSKTEGIDIVDWMAEKEGHKICFHIWDFGGQEIYHTLYPLFMTKMPCTSLF